jgi:hypothetical protein
VCSRSRLRAAIVILLMQVASAHAGTLADGGVLQHELQSLADRFDGRFGACARDAGSMVCVNGEQRDGGAPTQLQGDVGSVGRSRWPHCFQHAARRFEAAVIALCGTIAQLRAVPGSPLTASDDFAVIDRCADQRGCRAEAQRLVDENWPLIERIAAELLEHGELKFCGAVAERIGAALTRGTSSTSPRHHLLSRHLETSNKKSRAACNSVLVAIRPRD